MWIRWPSEAARDFDSGHADLGAALWHLQLRGQRAGGAGVGAIPAEEQAGPGWKIVGKASGALSRPGVLKYRIPKNKS